MLHYDNEKTKDALLAKARIYRAAAARIKDVKPVVRSFNGKVYNKRFDEAIRAIDPDYSIMGYAQHGWYSITYTPNHCYNDKCTLMSGYSTIKEYERYKTEDKYKIFNDSKRIQGDKMIDNLNSHYEELLKNANELERAAEDIAETTERVKIMVDNLTKYIGSLPSEVVSLCDFTKLRYL